MLRNYKTFFVQSLREYDSNSRTHSDIQIDQVAHSINEFGFTAPILIDENNVVLAGHCRLKAARKLGLKEVPCVVVEGLTDIQKKAYVIADNKLTLNADWDFGILKSEFEALKADSFDLELTGFSPDEIAELFAEDKPETFVDEDSCPGEQAETICQLGDIWILGEHRLMCGDSTSIDDVLKLLNGNKTDLIFTDPPYGVSYQSHAKKEKNIFDKIKNDDLSPEEFKEFIGEVCSVITLLDAPYYIWCNWKFYGVLQSLLPFTACIVWAKNYFGLGNGYRHQHEFCLTNAKIDDHIKDESDLWNIDKDVNYVHPTQKPVALAKRALGNHSKAKNIVDLFGGSGSTLIACQDLNKRCFAMELEPKYCDIIIKRFEIYTGQKAKRELFDARSNAS